MSFANYLTKNRQQPRHIIHTYDTLGRACWFVLEANERQIASLASTRRENMIDLNSYGKVIESGWGQHSDKTDS